MGILSRALALELLSDNLNSIWFGCEPSHLDFVSNLFALGFSLGPFRLEDSLVNFALGTFVRKLSLRSFRPGMLVRRFSIGTCRFCIFVRDVCLGNCDSDLPPGALSSRTFITSLPRNPRLGTTLRELSLRELRLGVFAWTSVQRKAFERTQGTSEPSAGGPPGSKTTKPLPHIG